LAYHFQKRSAASGEETQLLRYNSSTISDRSKQSVYQRRRVNCASAVEQMILLMPRCCPAPRRHPVPLTSTETHIKHTGLTMWSWVSRAWFDSLPPALMTHNLYHYYYYYISLDWWMTQNVYWTHTSVCVCVCLSLAAFPHYCMDPEVIWRNGRPW